MPTMVSSGRELICISQKDAHHLDYSTNDGRTWTPRYANSSYGTFLDLLYYGQELLAITSKGLYYSTNDGRTWTPRFTGTTYGDFLTLVNGGKELLAQTSKGLYYSTNDGRTWIKRH